MSELVKNKCWRVYMHLSPIPSLCLVVGEVKALTRVNNLIYDPWAYVYTYSFTVHEGRTRDYL